MRKAKTMIRPMILAENHFSQVGKMVRIEPGAGRNHFVEMHEMVSVDGFNRQDILTNKIIAPQRIIRETANPGGVIFCAKGIQGN